MLNIRLISKEDFPRVQEVAKISWHTTYEGLIPFEVQNQFLQQAYNDNRLIMRMEQSHFFVSEENGVINGFANFSPVSQDGKVELGAIYLLPEAQGNGIGTALLQHGLEQLDGVKEVYISVERDNLSGLHFYEAKGFEVIDEFEEEFGGAMLKTIRMKLTVSSC